MDHVKLAVNGTLMRGLPLEKNLLDAGAFFLREAATAPCYRLWSINDNNPAMLRVSPEDPHAVSVAVEVWQVPAAGLASVLVKEPEGLSVGKVSLSDGEVVLGVIGEPELLHGMKEISSFGGWRNYIASRGQEARHYQHAPRGYPTGSFFIVSTSHKSDRGSTRPTGSGIPPAP